MTIATHSWKYLGNNSVVCGLTFYYIVKFITDFMMVSWSGIAKETSKIRHVHLQVYSKHFQGNIFIIPHKS